MALLPLPCARRAGPAQRLLAGTAPVSSLRRGACATLRAVHHCFARYRPGRAYVASIDLNKVLDKAWADKPLTEILAAPVSALKGVSDRDGELLKEAFDVTSVADLAELKYVRWAQALAALDAAK
jgi:hypothetical protein